MIKNLFVLAIEFLFVVVLFGSCLFILVAWG